LVIWQNCYLEFFNDFRCLAKVGAAVSEWNTVIGSISYDVTFETVWLATPARPYFPAMIAGGECSGFSRLRPF
jgi:hypothetical protein